MEKSGFFNAELDQEGNYDREYLAEDFADYFSQFISNGVFPNPSTGLQVVESRTPDMSVVLNRGYAYINGYKYENTDGLSFKIDVADGQLDRKDAIFIRFDRAKREIRAHLIKGHSSASAIPPTIVRTADYWDLCVAVISVNAGVTKITQDLIEDRRLDNSVCGIVTNVVQSVDTKTLYAQIQKDLEHFRTVSQAEFDRWFEDINNKLGTEPATSLQKQINTINDHMKYFSATFLSGKWTYDDVGAQEEGHEFGYTQTVPCDGVKVGYSLSAPFVFDSGSGENREALRRICQGRIKVEDGKLSAMIINSLPPTTDVTIYMKRNADLESQSGATGMVGSVGILNPYADLQRKFEFVYPGKTTAGYSVKANTDGFLLMNASLWRTLSGGTRSTSDYGTAFIRIWKKDAQTGEISLISASAQRTEPDSVNAPKGWPLATSAQVSLFIKKGDIVWAELHTTTTTAEGRISVIRTFEVDKHSWFNQGVDYSTDEGSFPSWGEQ